MNELCGYQSRGASKKGRGDSPATRLWIKGPVWDANGEMPEGIVLVRVGGWVKGGGY